MTTVIAMVMLGEVEGAQERRWLEVDEGRRRVRDFPAGTENVELRTERCGIRVEAARVEVPVAGVNAIYECLECRNGFGGREGAVSGPRHKYLAQQVAISGLGGGCPIR